MLTSVDNRIDTRTASVVLRAEFANPAASPAAGRQRSFLRPRQAQESLMIPVAAVQQDAQGFYKGW